MKAVILSDVHGNLPALEAVLEAAEQEGAEELWCLGDLVGYNAEPEACTGALIEVSDICLAGNHDLVVNGTVDISVFAHDAAVAARWAKETLSAEALEQLRALRPSGERAGVELHHASPRDPVWEYLIDHSHVPLAYSPGRGGRANGGYSEPGTRALNGDRWLLNPGSVGQPRDSDPRAAYMVLDLDTAMATWRRVAYAT